MKKKKKAEMRVTYHYIEPNTKEEKESQERKVNKAYDLLFDAMLEVDGSGENARS